MALGEVVIQSMWSPAVTAVRTRGIPMRLPAAQRRLSRLGLHVGADEASERTEARLLLRIHELVHLRLPGRVYRPARLLFVGPDNAKKFMTEAEWDYWYGGKPAATDIIDPFGKLMEKAGRKRDGGAALGAHGQYRGVEFGHGRRPLSDPSLERVHHF